MVTKFEKVVEWDWDLESVAFPLGSIYGMMIGAYSFYFGSIWFALFMTIIMVFLVLLLGNIKRKVYWKKLSSKTESAYNSGSTKQ